MSVLTVNRVLDNSKIFAETILNNSPTKIYHYTCYFHFSSRLLLLYCPGGLPFHSEWTAGFSSFILLLFTLQSNETLS